MASAVIFRAWLLPVQNAESYVYPDCSPERRVSDGAIVSRIMKRLPWQRYEFVKGFIAYPDGDDMPHHYAAIWPEAGARFGAWRWLVRIDPPDKQPGDFKSGVWRNGVEPDKQAAADAATAAWPLIDKVDHEKIGSDPT